MNSFYVQCDCGWRSKNVPTREFADAAGKVHLDYEHLSYSVVRFETTAEPDKETQ